METLKKAAQVAAVAVLVMYIVYHVAPLKSFIVGPSTTP